MVPDHHRMQTSAALNPRWSSVCRSLTSHNGDLAMNRSVPAMATFTASLALMAGSAYAQNPASASASDHARPDEVKTSTTMPTETGTKTVRSGMPAQPAAGPAPPFAVLDKQARGFLDQSDAEGYPLLSTDFIKADANRDGKVSKAEYENWVAQP